MKRKTVRFTDEQRGMLQDAVERGWYDSQSEAVRDAVREKFRDELDPQPAQFADALTDDQLERIAQQLEDDRLEHMIDSPSTNPGPPG